MSLSDKTYECACVKGRMINTIDEEDVKEFIKELKYEMGQENCSCGGCEYRRETRYLFILLSRQKRNA